MSARLRRAFPPPRHLLPALVVCWVSGCGFLGCGTDALAELVQHGPEVKRDVAASQLEWRQAAVGDRFEMGDGLKTPRGQKAELKLFPSGGMRVEPGTLVRFQDTPPGETRRVRVDTGEIALDTGELEIDVDTGDGVAHVARGSRVRVGNGDGGVTLRVEVGQLAVERDGKLVTVGAGESLTIEVGELLLEPSQPNAVPKPASPADAGTPEAEASDAVAPAAPTAVEGDVGPGVFLRPPPPEQTLRLLPGEIATVHDPAPPTALALPVPCAGQGIVELGRTRSEHYDAGRVRAAGEVRVSLQPGAYRYRVRCDQGGKTSGGRVFIRRDPGTRALPRRPPRVTVDADGRPYTVRYQNLLPELTFAWPGAPTAARYVLRVGLAGGKTLSQAGGKPRITIASGKLDEGKHTFYFEAAGKRSRQGVLKIDFDNTARRAYLSSPRDGAVVEGGQVEVAGAAVTGSLVSIDGTDIGLSGQGRFHTQATLAPGRTLLAVRVRHARGGVHYYLRHLTAPR